jgi:hypothetical protein
MLHHMSWLIVTLVLLQAEAIGARHAASWAAKQQRGPAAFDPFEAAEDQVLLNTSPVCHKFTRMHVD